MADAKTPKPGPNPAPNPFNKPPANDGAAPPTSPVAVPPINIDPAAGQKKKILIIIVVVVVFLGLIALIPTLVLSSQLKKPKYTPTPTPEVIETGGQKADANARSDISAHVFVKATLTTRTAYDIVLKVPTAWDSSFSTAPTANYPWETGLTVTALTTRYSPLSSANLATKSNNYLAMIDITDWLKNDKNNYALTTNQKLAWFTATNSLTSASVAAAGPPIVNPRFSSEPGGKQHIVYVESKDKQLHGIAYSTLLNDKTYDPQIVIMMVGTLDKRSVVLYGVHAIRDKDWARLTNLQARNDSSYKDELDKVRNSFKTGNLGDDTKQVQDELAQALGTITISKTGQVSGSSE